MGNEQVVVLRGTFLKKGGIGTLLGSLRGNGALSVFERLDVKVLENRAGYVASLYLKERTGTALISRRILNSCGQLKLAVYENVAQEQRDGILFVGTFKNHRGPCGLLGYIQAHEVLPYVQKIAFGVLEEGTGYTAEVSIEEHPEAPKNTATLLHFFKQLKVAS